MNSISVREFAKIKDSPKIFLLDVRTKKEYDIVNLGGVLIPIDQISDRVSEIPNDKEIIVICHHGIRSAKVTSFLLMQGYTNVLNLTGGIDRYAIDIDFSLTRY